MDGLYLLWWVQEKQISPAVVATTLAAGDLALMALEVPSGWFADRFGHRTSLILGSLVQVAGILCCWLGEGIPGLIAASLLVALGDAFRSGADQALLYRTCVALGREHAFQQIEARSGAAELVAHVLLVLAGGAIVTAWGFAAGWAAEVVLCAAGLAIACLMVEPPAAGHGTTGDTAGTGSSTTAGMRAHGMAAIVVPVALLGGAASIASFLAQTAGHSTPYELTLLVATMRFAEAGGAMLAVRLPQAGARPQAALAAGGAVLLAAAVSRPSLFFPVAVVLAFLQGMALPLRAAAIQRMAGDTMRARAASLASACDMAVSTVALPLAGIWQSRRRR